MTEICPRTPLDDYCLRVLNYQQIRAAFGEAAAQVLIRRLEARASAFLLNCGLEPDVEIDGAGVIASAGLKHLAAQERRLALESLACALTAEPIRIGNVSVVVALGESSEGQADDLSLSATRCTAASESYILQMRRAADAYQAVADGRLSFAHQPIESIDGSELLYQEVLARITEGQGDGVPMSPACFIPAMERLGLVRLFDRQVVSFTIAALRRSPGVRLGCNISALSAVPDLYWEAAFAALAADRELAARFTVEVTETLPLPDLTKARAFFAQLQSFGCMVALDDFGVGFTSISQALALRPDIIKIDSSFLRQAVDTIFGGEFLASIMSLASLLATQVVVEGVEDWHHLEAARAAGALWLQGYYIGEPKFPHVSPTNSSPATGSLVAMVTASGAPMVNGWVRL